jgi:class 3 adenylate cyclase
VQTLTRSHGVDILITDAVLSELDPGFELEAMPPEQVKGIAEPVATFAVRGRITGKVAAG